MTEPHHLNCTGMLCPQPVIELARAVKHAETGTKFNIVTDDPAAAVDIPAWSRMRGHACVLLASEGSVLTHQVLVVR